MILTLTMSGVLAQAASAAADADIRIQSIWDFVVKGGPVMVPIGLGSLVAAAIIIERAVSLRRGNVIPPGLLAGIKGVYRDPRDRDKAVEYCTANGSPLAVILAAGIRKIGDPTELLEKHIEDAGLREVVRLRKHLRVLGAIASVSTLLGLLGTILGMIKAFETVAASGEALGKTELLAKGIYEAMITTAGGLLVAIPVVISHQWLTARVDHLVAEMDQITVDFVEEVLLPGRTRELPAPAPDSGRPEAKAEAPSLVLASAQA